jgi:hypothetical protein
MPIVSIGMIVELNKILKEKGFPFTVHLSDACGSQSMRIETLDKKEPRSVSELVCKEIIAYFDGQRIPLEFSLDKHAFWVPRS